MKTKSAFAAILNIKVIFFISIFTLSACGGSSDPAPLNDGTDTGGTDTGGTDTGDTDNGDTDNGDTDNGDTDTGGTTDFNYGGDVSGSNFYVTNNNSARLSGPVIGNGSAVNSSQRKVLPLSLANSSSEFEILQVFALGGKQTPQIVGVIQNRSSNALCNISVSNIELRDSSGAALQSQPMIRSPNIAGSIANLSGSYSPDCLDSAEIGYFQTTATLANASDIAEIGIESINFANTIVTPNTVGLIPLSYTIEGDNISTLVSNQSSVPLKLDQFSLIVLDEAGYPLAATNSTSSESFDPGTEITISDSLIFSGTASTLRFVSGYIPLPNSDPGEPVFQCGSLLQGSIDQEAETDLYRFSGAADETLAITLRGDGIAARVFTPSGAVATGFLVNNQTILTLSESGTYVIEVVGQGFVNTGSYSLGLECLVPPSPDAIAISCGSLESGSIDSAAEADLYTFSGAADETVAITLRGDGIAARVFTPSGAVATGFLVNNQTILTLSESGTYVIEVVGQGFVNTGSYSLGLECLVPPSPDAIAISCGSLESGSIDSAAEADLYTFSGAADETVAITLRGDGIAARVFTPSGAVATGFLVNNQTILTLSESGTYVIEVVGQGYVNTGSYSLGLECLGGP